MTILAPHDFVVGRGAEQCGLSETVSDLNALDGLNRHECGGQACIEALARGHVCAQADGNVVCDHFGDAADRVTRLLGSIDGCLKAGVILRIECAHRGLAQRRLVRGSRRQRGLGALGPDGDDVGHETNTGDLL